MKLTLRLLNILLFVLFCAVMANCGGGGGGSNGGGTAPQTTTFTLNWSAPTTDEGGGELTGLSGYYIYYGASPRTGDDPKICSLCGYTQRVNVGNVTSYVLNLVPGTYYFSVNAYDAAGNLSIFSDEASATK